MSLQSLKSRVIAALPLSLITIISSITPAQAIRFDFTYDQGFTKEQITGIEMAGGIWSEYLTNSNANVSIHFGLESVADGIIGGAIPAFKTNQNYKDFRKALNDPNPSNTYLKLHQDGTISTETSLMLTNANAKQLGLSANKKYGGLDGYIQLSALTDWQFDYAQDVSDTQFDYVSTVLHEIGHVLGFVSSTDNSSAGSQSTPLDLYRFSSESSAKGAIDARVGATAYFSSDGGVTADSYFFAKGENTSLGGDGFEASHWTGDKSLGLFSAQAKLGSRSYISSADLQALQAMGWVTNQPANLDLDLLKSQAQKRAAKAVLQDRTADVTQMSADAPLYQWRYFCNKKFCFFGQRAENHEAAEVPEVSSFPTTNDSTQVPEPASTTGLLALGLLGIGSLLKRQHHSKHF